MYSMFHQLHPPTGIEHSLYCRFIDPSEDNLVIAGVNQLHVYRLNADLETAIKVQEKPTDKIPDPRSKKHKLECIATYQLFGNVMSMQSVRLAGAKRDSLVLSFAEAKLSMIEYDQTTHDLKTTSLHYFEEEDLKNGILNHSHSIPYLRVDPEGRCAAMLAYKTHLIILPFRKDTVSEEVTEAGQISRPPIMSSYIIDLAKMDEKVTNVIDVQFLHGYYEPTVLILYEPLPTWTGRVAVRKDSCSIIAISLNIQERVNPIIWSFSHLPYDALQAVPVPKPIGGVLVFAMNSLLYLNQSFPPYGVALNSLTLVSTDFLLRTQPNVKITLDCAQATFISYDKMVISLRGGELYVLTLMIDSMRAVRSFHMDKAAASVLTTCMCQCGEGYLFLGSRLGNSLLLKFTEKSGDEVIEPAKPTIKEPERDIVFDEPPPKKKKDDIGDWMATDVSQIDDLDELEVYGNTETPGLGSTITQYTFEVCDSIMNIGPCTRMVMGEPAFLSEEFSRAVDPDIELVTTSGYGKNGAISVLQRTIRPQVVTTFELPGCIDMWTVIGAPIVGKKEPEPEETDEKDAEKKEGEEDDTENKEEELENAHALLILSREDSSLILQTGQEIMELDHSGFSTQGPTVYAGNIGDNRYIIQVSQLAVRLMEGVNQLQQIVLDLGSPIVCCSVADPHVLLMSQEGQLVHLTLKHEASAVRLAMTKPHVYQGTRVLTLCTFRDVSGMFTTQPKSDSEPNTQVESEVKEDPDDIMSRFVDEEDELLYGSRSKPTEDKPKNVTSTKAKPQVETNVETEIVPTFWLMLARENGILEIYSLPDVKLCFMLKNFPMGQKVLVDSAEQAELGARTSSSLSNEKLLASQSQDMPLIKEILLVGLGNKASRPHLMARADEELYVYEAFPYYSGSTDAHLKIRFRKVPHGLIIKERRMAKNKKKSSENTFENKTMEERVRWLRPFNDISGYSGVFVCGPYPHWLFMSPRGILRTHPFSIDGTVNCFTPFHNVNCPKGFLYFNKKGELRISVLPTHLSYDAPWPVRKVPLRCTPHFVVYHPESKTYSVVTSISEHCNKVCKLVGDGEKEFEAQDKDDRFILPTMERFSVQLFSPVSWEPIPNTKIDFEEFEHITAIKYVILKSEGTVSGLKGYVAVGTNYSYNEEVTSRGRIIIFDVIEVVPEPGQPLTKNKMKMEYDKEQKGPVSALDHVQGYLVTAMGQKIYIWQLKDQDLSGVAFIDTQVYIHTLSTIKNMILAADICKSITLLRYQEDMKVLSLVSRDIKMLEVYDTAYLVDNTSLCFLVSDRMKNLIVFSYVPEVRDSHGGQRLLRKADFNVGSHVNCFFRIRCKRSDPSIEKPVSGLIEKRHVTYFGTLDGSIGFLLPITEKLFRRMSMVQNALNMHTPHVAGLNPKAYRMLQNEFRILSNPQKNILDGDLIWKYLQLSVPERVELAKRIGTTVDQIIDDLLEIDRCTAHF